MAASTFDIFRQARQEAMMRPVPRSLRLQTPADRMQRTAAYQEAEAVARIEASKHSLYAMKLPMAGLLGTITYLLWTTLNSNGTIVKDFVRLVNTQQDILDEVNGIFSRSAREGFDLPEALKGSLSQLRDTLQAGSSPSDAARYMDEIRRHSTPRVQTTNLDNYLQQYISTTDRIFRNKKGMQAIASEPMVLKLLGVTKKTARRMAAHDRELFMQELMGKVMSGVDMSVFKKVFSRLDHVQFRIARLISAGVSIGLGGYFIIDNELKTKKLAKGL